MRPYRFSVSAYIACTLPGSLTSAAKKNASRHSEAVFSPASRPTSATHTFAPSDENKRAASRPMPPAAPVMTATLSSSLPTFEEPLALVGRDDLVEQRLLRARVVEVVVDHVVTECGTRHLAALEGADRIPQRVRKPLHVRLVRVALELRRESELLFDAVQAGRKKSRKTQVRVGVGAGYARLGAQVLAVADDAKSTCAVVVAPCQRRRRPAARGEALVGIDVGGEKDCQLRRVRDVAGEILLENRRLAVEDVALVLPQARVHVARAADPSVVGFGHERHRATLLVRHLLDPVLVDDVVVGHGQRVAETEVDLLLSWPRLTLRALDWNAGGLHPLADCADEGL